MWRARRRWFCARPWRNASTLAAGPRYLARARRSRCRIRRLGREARVDGAPDRPARPHQSHRHRGARTAGGTQALPRCAACRPGRGPRDPRHPRSRRSTARPGLASARPSSGSTTGSGRCFLACSGAEARRLQLTSEDVLGAGVTMMARPPGKRNASINLLSGGEKALTAIALVFAIFELNPLRSASSTRSMRRSMTRTSGGSAGS